MRYGFEDRSWLVLAAATLLIVLLVVVAGGPTGRDRVLVGEVVDFGVYGRRGRPVIVRFASGDMRMVLLTHMTPCDLGDKLRVIETPNRWGATFTAAPEGCVRAPR